jgi:hypothetical protein
MTNTTHLKKDENLLAWRKAKMKGLKSEEEKQSVKAFCEWYPGAMEDARQEDDKDFPDPAEHVNLRLFGRLYQYWKSHGPESKITDCLRKVHGIHKAITIDEALEEAEKWKRLPRAAKRSLEEMRSNSNLPPVLEIFNETWSEEKPLYAIGEVARTQGGDIVFTYMKTRWNNDYKGKHPHHWESVSPEDVEVNYPLLKARLEKKARCLFTDLDPHELHPDSPSSPSPEGQGMNMNRSVIEKDENGRWLWPSDIELIKDLIDANFEVSSLLVTNSRYRNLSGKSTTLAKRYRKLDQEVGKQIRHIIHKKIADYMRVKPESDIIEGSIDVLSKLRGGPEDREKYLSSEEEIYFRYADGRKQIHLNNITEAGSYINTYTGPEPSGYESLPMKHGRRISQSPTSDQAFDRDENT